MKTHLYREPRVRQNYRINICEERDQMGVFYRCLSGVTGGPAFDFASTSNKVGAPSFRVVCERVGGRLSIHKFKRYGSEVPTLAKNARMGHPRLR
jgi:hypothetical protein